MASEGQEILSIALSVSVRSDRYGSTLAISSRGWEDSDGGEYDDAAFSEDVSEHSDPPTSGSEVALWGRSVQAGHSAREDPWEAAKARFSADLEPSEQTIFNNTTLENLFRVTNGAVRDDDEESRLLTVSRKLGPLVAAVESFGTAIDILARIDLASIWGSIKVVLQIARTHEKSHDQVIDTLGRIGDLLPRLRDYERVYSAEKHQRLAHALSNAYLDVINLCAQLRKVVCERKTSESRRLWRLIPVDRQLEETVERFRQHKRNVEEEARICHMIEAAEARNEAWLVLYAVERRRKLLSKLSEVDYEYKQRKLKAQRHVGTGVWLEQHTGYKQWLTEQRSSVLCCYGIPGCGKSVLASNIIDTLRNDNSVIFYFVDHADRRTLDPATMFGALSRQLLDRTAIVPESLEVAIEQAPHDGDSFTDQEYMLELLRQLLSLQPNAAYIVLDGLHEMSENSRQLVCTAMSELMNNLLVSSRIILTARADLKPVFALQSAIKYIGVAVPSSNISFDIESYVRHSVRSRILHGDMFLEDPALEEIIVNRLVQGAKGMFLWVEFQLTDLSAADTDHGIRCILEDLPKSLGETYDRLLGKIEGKERRAMISRLLKWIVCARQPLHVDELREAIAFTINDAVWKHEKIPTDFQRLLTACGNLVVIDSETEVVQLAHYTFQEYLLQPGSSSLQFTMCNANIIAGELCIAYLNFSEANDQITRYRPNVNTDIVLLGRIASGRRFLTTDNPGQRAVRLWRSLRSSNPVPHDINMARFAPTPVLRAATMARFRFLLYASKNWLWHTIAFESDTSNSDQYQISLRNRLFVNVATSKNLLCNVKPLGAFDESDRLLSLIAMLGWALTTNHVFLIHQVGHKINPPLLLKEAWISVIANRPFSQSTIQEMRILEKEAQPSSLTMHMWLISRLFMACDSGHNECLDACGFAEMDDRAIYHFLLLAAAESSSVSVVQRLAGMSLGDQRLQILWEGNWSSALERAILSGRSENAAFLSHESL